MWIFKTGENEAVNLDHTVCIERSGGTSVLFHLENQNRIEYIFDDESERDEYFTELMQRITGHYSL